MTTTKWLVYTLFFGGLPMIARLAVAFLARTPVPMVSSSDIVGLGFVLAITNIHGVESTPRRIDPDWKSQTLGLSILWLVLLTVGFVGSCLPGEVIDGQKTLWSTAIVTIAAAGHAFTVVERIGRRTK